ncbi:hypothetical protein EJB05_26557, partial [Eragrostis curvula]
MGKCGVRSCGEQRRCSSAAVPAAAAGYLTLRSGRRVPAVNAASCSPMRSRRQHYCRGGSGRRCGGGAKSARSSPRRKSATAAGVRQCCRVVTSHPVAGGGRPEQETPAQATNPASHDDDDRCGGAGSRPDTLLSDEAALPKRPYEANGGGVADQPARPSPPPEAEIEAFFAAAELAERRRFAETYNYDVVLDRPLEGRFEWAPVST